MEPEDEDTLTIARRTRKNLEYVYKRESEGADVEEFTQLLNSMLGIVISLREDYFKCSSISWKYVEDQGLLEGRQGLATNTGKPASPESPDLEQVDSFSQLITRLRHSFAHHWFKLILDNRSDGKPRIITGITVWNIKRQHDNKPRYREWEAEFSEADLKRLAFLLIEYLEREFGL
jgi:HEPN pEK499 p136